LLHRVSSSFPAVELDWQNNQREQERTEQGKDRARKDRRRKGGGATTALQDRHQTRKEKEAQGEFCDSSSRWSRSLKWTNHIHVRYTSFYLASILIIGSALMLYFWLSLS
jgi:hypothetical protein